VKLGPLCRQVRAQTAELVAAHPRLRLVDVRADKALVHALLGSPVKLSTMGRALDQDPGAFVAAAVAGVHAVDLLDSPA
jgi:hypothetical protein